MKRDFFPILVGVVIAASGCSMIPTYSRPPAPVPHGWPGGDAYSEGLSPTNARVAGGLLWSDFFIDDRLRQYIRVALQNNRDLRLAVLNVERSRAMYGIQRAELLPAVNAVGTGSRQRVPADLSSTGSRQIVDQYGVSLGVVAWEPDFFGRIRSLKDRALEEYLATEQARRSAQILLIASVANAYLTSAADRECLALAENTLVAQQGAYDLVKRRFDLGLAPELDSFRAHAQVDAARGDVVRFKQLVAIDANALNLLLGSHTFDAPLPSELGSNALFRVIRAGVPSEVLLTRPDVLQAEGLLRAANADIGAARAAFFPRISLTAAFGTASGELTGLFKGGSSAWSFAPQIVIPAFDARVWAASKAAKVQREIAVNQYERTIQGAFREVADALAVRGTVDQQLAAQESLVHAVSETYRLSNVRYTRGIDSYLSVLDAQRSLYAAQQGLVSLRLAKLSSYVRLYAVLGCGWQVDETDKGVSGGLVSGALDVH